MTVVLILGLALLAAAVMTVARALVGPRGAGETVQQIGQYGFRTTDVDVEAEKVGVIDRLATAAGEALSKRSPWFKEEEIRHRLVSAGMYSTTPWRFLGYQALLSLALLCVWVWLAGVSGMGAFSIVLGAVIAIGVGWVLPLVYVLRRIRHRRQQIEYELPEMIDLIIVAVEAGVSLLGALRIASREVAGPLGEELRLTLQETNLGLATTEALANFAKRADTPGMRMFIRGVMQGEALGIAIAQIMRNLADEMRKRRKAAAEERARKAPIKMIFPLVFLIFPAMFIVLVLPALLTITKVFG